MSEGFHRRAAEVNSRVKSITDYIRENGLICKGRDGYPISPSQFKIDNYVNSTLSGINSAKAKLYPVGSNMTYPQLATFYMKYA